MGTLTQFAYILGLHATFSFPVSAATNLPKTGFITAPNRADIAYDTQHELLYISGDSSLLRYDMHAQKFSAPIQLGGNRKGMDISSDGKTLAVANSSRGATKILSLSSTSIAEIHPELRSI